MFSVRAASAEGGSTSVRAASTVGAFEWQELQTHDCNRALPRGE